MLEAKQAVAARDDTIESLKNELAVKNTTAVHTPSSRVHTHAKPGPSGSRVSAAKHKTPRRPDAHYNQVPAEKRNEQPKRVKLVTFLLTCCQPIGSNDLFLYLTQLTKKAPQHRRFAELRDFFGAAPAAPKLASGEKPLNPYERDNDPAINKKIEQMLSNLPASEARRVCHDRQFLGMKITQAKVQLFNQFKVNLVYPVAATCALNLTLTSHFVSGIRCCQSGRCHTHPHQLLKS
ncbi:MAG: hypothetical protein GY787_22905 [Alteromonadales bacterium]|nr:hypothetical protein [Alteromonadales bacterium]